MKSNLLTCWRMFLFPVGGKPGNHWNRIPQEVYLHFSQKSRITMVFYIIILYIQVGSIDCRVVEFCALIHYIVNEKGCSATILRFYKPDYVCKNSSSEFWRHGKYFLSGISKLTQLFSTLNPIFHQDRWSFFFFKYSLINRTMCAPNW